MQIPKDTYGDCVRVAKSYYLLLARKREIEREILLSSPPPPNGMPRGGRISDKTGEKAERLIRRKAVIERKLGAIQAALDGLRDEHEMAFIRKNLFDRIPMEYIPAPMCERTMQSIRRAYIVALAYFLDEI